MIELNSANFEEEVYKSDKPVVIDFWAPWCGPCRMMAPVLNKLDHEFQGKVKFAKLNTDHEPDIARSFGIRGIPTLKIVNNGVVVDSIVGFGPKPILKARIEDILKKA